MLDTVVAIETPEGIDFELVPSGPLARILAYTSDFLIRAAVMLMLAILLATLGAFGSGIMLLSFFILEWLYPVFFEVKSGATPGKYWMRLRVVQDDGTPVTLSSSLLRNLLRTADFLPLFYLTGLVSMLCNREFKRLGDLAAGTLVIQLADPLAPAGRVNEKPVPLPLVLSTPAALSTPAVPSTPLVPSTPPTPSTPLTPSIPMVLSAEEQQAIVQFTLRASDLSAARQLELAKILQPILSCPEHQLVLRLRQAGSYFLGTTAPGNVTKEQRIP